MAFFLEVLIGGLLVGVLYSLVALGFVLIFKASGVFNFAQGAMVLMAGLVLVQLLNPTYIGKWHFAGVAALVAGTIGVLALRALKPVAPTGGGGTAARRLPLLVGAGTGVLGGILALSAGGKGWPVWLAVPASAIVMVAIAYAIERVVLRRLVNQEGIILFMATLGITFFIDGFGQTIFGSNVYKLDPKVYFGIPNEPVFLLEGVFPGGILVNNLDIWGGIVAALLVGALAVFFQYTRTGRALRAVADDHAAAQSVGIPLNWIWFIVWSVAGIVALVAAMVWGSKLGIQFSITFLALKALPVLILGGFTSVPGAIVGGLLIGAGEKLAEVYLPQLAKNLLGIPMSGGIEYWFAYVLALAFLLFRPQGLFGERIIERV
jgi:branched-chain amino acid transport system permease protein